MFDSADLLLWNFARKSRCITDADGNVVGKIELRAHPDLELVVRDGNGTVSWGIKRVRTKRWWEPDTRVVIGPDGRALGVLKKKCILVEGEPAARLHCLGLFLTVRCNIVDSGDGHRLATVRKRSWWRDHRYELHFVDPLRGDFRKLVAAATYVTYLMNLD